MVAGCPALGCGEMVRPSLGARVCACAGVRVLVGVCAYVRACVRARARNVRGCVCVRVRAGVRVRVRDARRVRAARARWCTPTPIPSRVVTHRLHTGYTQVIHRAHDCPQVTHRISTGYPQEIHRVIHNRRGWVACVRRNFIRCFPSLLKRQFRAPK